MKVLCDQLRLKQILMNIQSNALKFTKDNGEVHIVCQYVKGRSSAKKAIKSKDDTRLRESLVPLQNEEEYNESADSANDSQQINNDRGAMYLDFA